MRSLQSEQPKTSAIAGVFFYAILSELNGTIAYWLMPTAYNGVNRVQFSVVLFDSVAQRIEQLPSKQLVVGSSPT